jgi:23S rRNA A1618 N6-methylase RlmF
MEMTMLEFAEAVLREIRKLQQQSEQIVLNGTIADMERYRFMMGRLEGLKMVEDSVKSLLRKVTDDDDLTN